MKDWDIKKAGERLIWRLRPNEKGQHTSFKPNENDFNALKTVLRHITLGKENNASKHTLFAKLYIYQLTTFTRQYGTTIFNDHVQVEVSKMLNYPLSYFYDAFYSDLITNQIDTIVRGENVNVDSFKKVYDKETVDKQLEHMVTEALNRFK